MSSMSGAEEIGEIKHASFLQRDLLQGFLSRNRFSGKLVEKIQGEEIKKDEEEIELSLGLSSNGRFGVDPERAKKLIRSSSISNFTFSSDEKDTKSWIFSAAYEGALTRTSSLPLGTQEEWRKRKELQSLRRLEAKRKRVEKLKNGRVVREKIDLGGKPEENGRCFLGINGSGEILTPYSIDGVELNGGRGGGLGGGGGLEGFQPPQFSSQGSIGSQGSGSSGVSDIESQPIGGSNKDTEERSPASVHSSLEQGEHKPNKPAIAADPSSKVTVAGMEANETTMNKMAEMPYVSTRGNGPNGRRIEGFLYRYKKGEEVSILCVCHGSFLSPAEFIKHAGGGDVTHPLRHIVISRSPFL